METIVDTKTRRKWDAASRTLDIFTFAEDRRLGPHKRRLFEKIRGRTLMVAAGTGNDFMFLPSGMHLLAIDISPKMLERAAKKAAAYPGTIELQEMDVRDLKFPDATFDTVLTVCTFCPGFHRDDETGVSALLRRGEVRERGRSQRGSG